MNEYNVGTVCIWQINFKTDDWWDIIISILNAELHLLTDEFIDKENTDKVIPTQPPSYVEAVDRIWKLIHLTAPAIDEVGLL